MKGTGRAIWKVALLLVAFFGETTLSYAQGNQPQQPQSPSQQQQHPQLPANQQAAPLTLDSTPSPVNAEEEAAIKAFRDESTEDADKKVQLAQDFLQKYPQSRSDPKFTITWSESTTGRAKWTKWSRRPTSNWNSTRMIRKRWRSLALRCPAR